MSKILELLQHTKKREPDKVLQQGPAVNFPTENYRTDVREKLASTYIYGPKTASPYILKSQAEETSLKNKQADVAASYFRIIPWLISFLAVLLLLASIIYREQVKIEISITKAVPPAPQPIIADKFTPDDISLISTPLISEGRYNIYVVKRLGFYGAASTKSKVMENGLYLFNDGTAGWASVGLDFKEPMDLSNASIDFFIKGIKGHESLRLILRDVENNSYDPQAYFAVSDKNMSCDWRFVSVPLNTLHGIYDPRKINHIGFEFGTQTTSNTTGDSIYIKNLKLVKNELR